MKNLELLSLSCASCGAKLEGFQGQSEIKCDFCNNTTRILRPVSVKFNESVVGLEKKDTFSNLIQIMEQSMIAENHQEAYNYCNKALEIDPSCGTLWENKAICCFWLRSDNNIIESQAKEIITYLNAAKINDPDSETYSKTVKNISYNLFFAAWYRYQMTGGDVFVEGNVYKYSDNQLKVIISYLNIMEIAFDLYPTEMYLNDGVLELTNYCKVHWINPNENDEQLQNAYNVNNVGFDAIKSREKYITKIKKINPDFIAPEFHREPTDWLWLKSWFYTTIALMLLVFFFVFNGFRDSYDNKGILNPWYFKLLVTVGVGVLAGWVPALIPYFIIKLYNRFFNS